VPVSVAGRLAVGVLAGRFVVWTDSVIVQGRRITARLGVWKRRLLVSTPVYYSMMAHYLLVYALLVVLSFADRMRKLPGWNRRTRKEAMRTRSV
jgi:hypothetical protein